VQESSVVDTVGETSLDEVSHISAVSEPATDAELHDDDECSTRTAASPGNFDLILHILAGMCDGQYTDLQASCDVTVISL